MQERPSLETAALSVEDALAAEEGGADRFELCASRIEGAITPSGGLIKATCRAVNIDVHVMIRPRGGNFVYNSTEIETMIEDISLARDLGASGVLFGVTEADLTLNLPVMEQLVAASKGLAITCHRAFDLTPDPFATMEQLIDLGVDRILTSGKAPIALDGRQLLRQLVERAGDRVIIMPGGGISLAHLQLMVEAVGAREYHVVDLFTQERIQSTAKTDPQLPMGVSINVPEDIVHRLSPSGVQRAREILSG